MPFIPHTADEVAAMLRTVGVAYIGALFDEIPPGLRIEGLTGVPDGLPEWEVGALLAERTAGDRNPTCFLGAGAYQHHIPAAVWQLVSRVGAAPRFQAGQWRSARPAGRSRSL
jgi:glycine dehydrogenase subunit 1